MRGRAIYWALGVGALLVVATTVGAAALATPYGKPTALSSCSTATSLPQGAGSAGTTHPFDDNNSTNGSGGTDQNQSGDNNSGDNQTGSNDSGGNQTAENDSGDNQTAENDSGDNQTAENDSGSNQTAENDSGDNQTAENHSGDNQTADNNTWDNETSDNGSADNGTVGLQSGVESTSPVCSSTATAPTPLSPGPGGRTD